MALTPKIPAAPEGTLTCVHCGAIKPLTSFPTTQNPFFPAKRYPLCGACITAYLTAHSYSWEAIDKLCQLVDIPFIPNEVERTRDLSGDAALFSTYSKIFATSDYESIGWDYYFKQFQKLREVGLIEEELPELREEKFRILREAWGENYDDQELGYLEDFYKGLKLSQNINGKLQDDQARKICKLSLEIDKRIRAGDKDVDKFLSSYDKLVKAADFTPKTVKNATDFDSIAEISFWLEKRGWQNKFYDGATRDVIDELLKNIENYNQRLYINEGGIGDSISKRLDALKAANDAENFYGTQQNFDNDQYEAAGFNVDLGENDEFEVQEDN